MSLIYKPLFEVKLLHEFYCTGVDGKTIFEFSAQQDRMNFLLSQFTENKQSVNTDIDFFFPEVFQKNYADYNLKIVPSYSGFKVLVRVSERLLSDGSIVYYPITSIPADLNIYIALSKKNALFDAFTNSTITNSLPSIYFFSNDTVLNTKSFPFITNNISAVDNTRIYDQGELASFGVNDIREYYKDISGKQWQQVTGGGFANENDRMLLPAKFYYSFNNSAEIFNADFNLKDASGNIIKTIAFNSSDPAKRVLLNFSGVVSSLVNNDSFLFNEVMYSLEIRGNNGYAKDYKIIFSDVLYDKSCWGIVHIKADAENSSFNLFDTDGFLIKRKDALGVWTEAPVFEIPVKSKFIYWRFINDKGKELKLNPLLADYLFKENKILLSKRPKAVSKFYFLLQKEGTTDTVYVPNPVSYDLKKDDRERLCFDISVPESELFPII
ncbi:MAG: hypothetical protein QM763_09610 [Agriterribacter sp.]